MKHTLKFAVSAIALLAAGAAGANTIGSVAALNKNVDGTPPAGAKRTLVLGDGVVQDELIESSPIGSGQLMFLDQTTMTVAKNSSIVLDKYVYDPETKTGELALTMSKGVMRFIGGRITKNSDAVIVTPTATIGIRGGMSIVTVDEDGTTRAMHIAGTYTKVTTEGGGEVTVTRSNGMAEVSPDGEVTYIGVPNSSYLGNLINDLIGRGEAGEEVDPQDPDVVESGIIVVNSGAKGIEEENPVATTGESADSGGDDDDPTITRNEEEVQTVIVNGTPPGVLLPGVTGGASTNGSGIGGLAGGGEPDFPFDEVYEGSRIGLTADGVAFIVPTDAPGFSTFAPPQGSSPEGFLTGTVFFDPDAEFTYSVFTTELGNTGSFLAGTPSGAPGAPAEGTVDVYAYRLSDDLFFGDVAQGGISGATPFLPGNITAFSSDGGTDLLLILDGSDNVGEALYGYLDINGAGPGQSAGLGVLTADLTLTSTGQPVFDDTFIGTFYDGAAPAKTVFASARPAEDGQGSAFFGPDGQYAAIANGGAGGESVDGLRASVLVDGDALAVYGNNSIAEQVDAETLTDEDRGEVAEMSGYAAVAASDGGPGPYVAYNVEPGNVFIGPNEGDSGLGAEFFLTDILSDVDDVGDFLTSLTVTTGGGPEFSAALDSQSFAMQDGRDDDQINGEDATGAIVLATAGLVGDGGVFPGGTDTQPQYLTWGWWGGPLAADNSADVGADVAEQQFNLGVFIAGDLTDTADLPQGGVATYEGFAVVSATSDGATFVDGAGFDLAYNFGRGTGTIGFDDLLGDDPVFAVGAEEPRGYGGVGSMTALGSEALVAVAGDFFTGGELEGIGATAGSVQVLALDGSLTAAGVYGGDATGYTPELTESIDIGGSLTFGGKGTPEP